MNTYTQAAVVVDVTTGAVLRKIATTGPEQLNEKAHVGGSEQWIVLDDPNDLSEAAITAKVQAVTGKTPPQLVKYMMVDQNTSKVAGTFLAYPGVNDQPPSGFTAIAVPSQLPSDNPDWTKWTYSAGVFTAPLPPPVPPRGIPIASGDSPVGPG